MSEPAHRVIRWWRLDTPGDDLATLARDAAGWTLSGVATFTAAGDPCRLEYRVTCDDRWRTRRCTVSGTAGNAAVAIDIVHDGEGRWTLGGDRVASVDGCDDVDLSFTPATNLLPIRRLALAAGASASVRAAWLRFPELTLEVLEQVYTRLDAEHYRYESAGGAFRRELTVDATGFVLAYPGLWIAERR